MKLQLEANVDVEEGEYVVSCPDFPGCTSRGSTREEALKKLRVQVRQYLLTRP